MFSSSKALLPTLVLWLAFRDACAVNVSVHSMAPSSSQQLARTLVSFSLEQDRWPDWVGTDSPNQFTLNALGNYAELTGQTPKIRVGANSEDHTVWSPTVTINEDEFPPPNTITPYPEATKITVGDKYYELSKFLPSGTHMIWGVNLGLNNITNAVNMAKSIVKAFGTSAVKQSGVILDMIEIGNEADLYKNNGLRPSNWTVDEYVANWIEVATPVAQAANIEPHGSVTFQGAAFAGTGFTPTQIFNLGILSSTPGEAITTISQHRYSAAFCNGGDFPLTSFMSKANVRGNLTLFEADIAATHSRGLRYTLGETNSIACHGAPGVSNTAGAALWGIDYILQAATLGITEVFFHDGIGYKYNFFQPIALNRSIIDASAISPPQPPHVMPMYYGGLVVTTAVGRTGSSTVVELSVGDSNVSGYAIYEHGVLARAVFVNLHAWLQSSTGTRPSVHIDLGFAGNTPHGNVKAQRLVIQHADDTQNLTWAGQSFETADAKPTGKVAQEDVSLSSGFDLRATEAILINF